MNLCKRDIESSKLHFLSRYNKRHSIDEAVTRAINSAVLRNQLYRKDIEISIRFEIRDFWRKQLLAISQKYFVNKIDKDIFLEDVLNLKALMNKAHSQYFYDEFRISHSQKSISVYLKHLWCMKKINTPPICPIDRTVLKAAGKKNGDASWTHINDINEYKMKLSWLEEEAIKLDIELAEWELLNF